MHKTSLYHSLFHRLTAVPAFASLCLVCHACWGQISPTVDTHSSADIRGAVYIPAGAFNAPQMWKNFSLAETRRDFGYARAIHLNALRIWVSYEYWRMEPGRSQTSFDQLLGAAHDSGIRVLVSLFEEDGVMPTPENMWATNPADAFDIQSPGDRVTLSHDKTSWDEPRSFVHWFMEHYRNDNRLLAIEVMNEPGNNPKVIPFAESMFETAKSMQGTVPLTVGSSSVRRAETFIPLGLDIIEYHDNFPSKPEEFEAGITNALAVGQKYHLPVWLTEWQRLRPSGSGWGEKKITAAERLPDYASLAPIVQKYRIGNFFWSLMIKWAYLPPQRAQGTVNGLFWADGLVWSLRDARAIANDQSIRIPERKVLPVGYLNYLAK